MNAYELSVKKLEAASATPLAEDSIMSTKHGDQSNLFKSRSRSFALPTPSSNANVLSKETMQFGGTHKGRNKRLIDREELKMSHILNF